MSYKLIGAILIMASCGFFGFWVAACCKKEERCLRKLIFALDYMHCELSYRNTALPELCCMAGEKSDGVVKTVLEELCREFSYNLTCDVSLCMKNALHRVKDIPPLTREALVQLGHSMGKFNIEGQLKCLDSAKEECNRYLQMILQNQKNRIRSYQTLGLCAGAALIILFI